MASYQDTIDRMMRLYPDLFPTELHCLDQLFLVIGNGYYWEDGQLVNRFERTDDEVISERELFDQEMAQSRAELVEALEKMNDQVMADRILSIMEELHAPARLCLYTICREYSKVFRVPDDVEPDWLAAAYKAIGMVLTAKPEQLHGNQAEEVELAKEAYEILRHRFGTGGNDET